MRKQMHFYLLMLDRIPFNIKEVKNKHHATWYINFVKRKDTVFMKLKIVVIVPSWKNCASRFLYPFSFICQEQLDKATESYLLCRPSNFLQIKDVTLRSWWRFPSIYWLEMVAVMMGFPSLLQLSILFFKRMAFRVQEIYTSGIPLNH